MENANQVRDKRTILQLYEGVLPLLATRIHHNLAGEVLPLFHNFHLERVIDTWSRGEEVSRDTPISLERGNVQQLVLRLQLEGFQGAGIAPFDLTKDLLFQLEVPLYKIGPGKEDVWLEKCYDQPWSEGEVKELAQQWCDDLLDTLAQRLEELM